MKDERADWMAGLPPLPTNLEDWHATVRLHRNPAYLRALADEIERRQAGERPAPRSESVADIFAEFRNTRRPKHQHEAWQLLDRADGGKYCGACGEPASEPKSGE